MWYLNPYRTKSTFEIPSLKKNSKNLEECFGINVQMKVIDLEIFDSIYSIRFSNAFMNIYYRI